MYNGKINEIKLIKSLPLQTKKKLDKIQTTNARNGKRICKYIIIIYKSVKNTNYPGIKAKNLTQHLC